MKFKYSQKRVIIGTKQLDDKMKDTHLHSFKYGAKTPSDAMCFGVYPSIISL